MSMMQKLRNAFAVVLGTACALLAGAAALYIAVFYTGAYDGASIHRDITHHKPNLITSHALLNNLTLLTIFLGSHSLLARDWIKSIFSPVLSPSVYRQFYFLVSSLALFLVAYGWSPQPHTVWHIENPALRLPLYGLSMSGGVLIVVAFFSIKPLEFCGLQDPINILLGRRSADVTTAADGDELMVTGVYGVVRHPMYTGILITLWAQPTMAQGQLLLAVVSTLYLFLVVPWLEERDLIHHFGDKYCDYINSTGMFFPHLTTKRQKLN